MTDRLEPVEPDFGEMLEVLEDCRRYLTEFGSVEPSSLTYRVNQAITNGRRAKDERSYREQYFHIVGAMRERGEEPPSYALWRSGADQ